MSQKKKKPIVMLAAGYVQVPRANYIMVNVEPTGEREYTYCLKRCSFAALPGESHSGLTAEQVKVLVEGLTEDGLQLVIVKDIPSLDILQPCLGVHG